MPPTEPVEVTPRLLREWALPEPGGSKYQRGRVMVIGGAVRTPGAVQLAGLAALRVGAGRLSLAVAEPVAAQLAVATPEAGVSALPVDDAGSVLAAGVAGLADDLGTSDAVVIGPGLDNPELTARLVDAALPLLGPRTCLVLDAFAVTVLSELGPLAPAVAARTVLTPNEDEAELLLGRPLGDDALKGVSAIARQYGAVVTCRDLVVTPAGEWWRVGVGHSGLATSGSGDVLAGAVGGVLARGAEPAQAACWAKFLHASAGERLAARIGRVGFLASEVLAELPLVLSELY